MLKFFGSFYSMSVCIELAVIQEPVTFQSDCYHKITDCSIRVTSYNLTALIECFTVLLEYKAMYNYSKIPIYIYAYSSIANYLSSKVA